MKSHFTTSVLHRKAFKGSVLVVRCLAWRHSKLHIVQVLAEQQTHLLETCVPLIRSYLSQATKIRIIYIDLQAPKNTSYSPITPPPSPGTHSQGDSLRLPLLHCKSHAVKNHLGMLLDSENFNAAFSVPTGWKECEQII